MVIYYHFYDAYHCSTQTERTILTKNRFLELLTDILVHLNYSLQFWILPGNNEIACYIQYCSDGCQGSFLSAAHAGTEVSVQIVPSLEQLCKNHLLLHNTDISRDTARKRNALRFYLHVYQKCLFFFNNSHKGKLTIFPSTLWWCRTIE